MKYLYLFALAIISLIIALLPKANTTTFVFNLGDSYYVFLLRTLCIGIICAYLTASILCATQTYFRANNIVTKIHFWGSLVLPLLLLFYKKIVWYKEADRSYLIDTPVVDFDLDYGNILVFALALIFCVMQIIALGNIILSTVRTLNLKP